MARYKNFVGAALAVVGSVVGGVTNNMALKKQAKMQNSAQNHEQSMFKQTSTYNRQENKLQRAHDAQMQQNQLDYQYAQDYTTSADNLISGIHEQEAINRQKQSTEMIVLVVLATSLIGGYVYLKSKKKS